ncbi:sesquipedalian-1 [Aplysia californica]|uniref:Sesquipedalian-1 n=1 Tax=Aplysia californica TaxID=6500 RepID=A0ABM0JZT7_APLCA|nr:sesquipedalian-1 [Aplysia californica]
MKILNEKGLIHFANSGAPADKEGYLQKKGEVNKGFQKRWFVLKGNLLFYYEKKGDKEPLGVIILEGCTIELAEDTDNFLFMINFASSGLRTYCLSAHSQESMESWMKALSCAGYEYVKLMVSELQSKLEEATNSAEANLVQAADRDSRILGRIYNDNAVLETVSRGSKSKSLQRDQKKRVNPFNDVDEMDSEVDPGDAFRHIARTSTIELVTWSLLGIHSFAEMHEFIRHQVQENKLESDRFSQVGKS